MKKFIVIISVLPILISSSFICIKNESERIIQINKPRLDKFSQYIFVQKVTSQGNIEPLLGDTPTLEHGAQLLLEIKDSIVSDLKIPYGQGLKITPILDVPLNFWAMAGRHANFHVSKRLPLHGELIYELEHEGYLDYFYRAWFVIMPSHVVKDWSHTLHKIHDSYSDQTKKECACVLSNETEEIAFLIPPFTKN